MTRKLQIIKSNTQLDFLSVSKVNLFIDCHRKYYWRYIRNFDSHKVSIPFFVGGFYHEGLEQFYSGKKPEDILSYVDESITEFLVETFIPPDEVGELELQRAIILGMLEGYFDVYASDRDKWEVLGTEIFVEMEMLGYDFPLIGTIDLVFRFKGRIWIGEHKTTSQIHRDYIDRLPFDLQVMLYPLLLEEAMGLHPHGVCYNITRKPSIRQKQNETFPDFVSRVSEDYVERREFYFHREEILFNKKYISQAWDDLTHIADELQIYHDSLDEKKILNRKNWYRNAQSCFQYGRCPFFNLCKHGDRTDQVMMFQQRDPGPSEESFLKKKKEKANGKKVKKRKKLSRAK